MILLPYKLYVVVQRKRDGSDDKMGFWYIFTNQWINIVII